MQIGIGVGIGNSLKPPGVSYETPSYANAGGSGNRMAAITVNVPVAMGGTFTDPGATGRAFQVNGNIADDSVYIEPAGSVAGLYFDFIFDHKVKMDKFKVYQGLTPTATHGTWKAQIDPENDGNLQDIGSSFTMGGAAQKEYDCPATDIPFKRLRVVGVSGNANTGGYAFWQEWEFKIANPS